MKAIALVPGTTNVSLRDVAEPKVSAPDDVKIKIRQVGICGTDREEVSGGRADAPAGKKELIIGHEMFGEVVETGEDVTTVAPGDYAVFTVRRGCNECPACLNNRSDLCYTGKYTERGIKGADGFQAQYVVDKEKYLVKVPESIKEIGVLTEPMSVAAKAIDEALIVQGARLKDIGPAEHWLEGKKALVAGIGAIGLMAAFALQLRGAHVIGMDVVDEDSLRPQLLKQIGGTYVDGRKVQTLDLDET
ncbi:MAG TPA: alcohol dehydrogenase catalytic domain-containing protein, partial [Flavisolibacter sp.]|nr:alcohol dehydrogenase catalytic domain-containing protein [Flavisolibacter sp.]